MFEFETPAGNMYAWDDEIGLFIPYSPVIKWIISNKSLSKKEVIEKLKENYGEEEIIFYYDWLQKWEKIKPKNLVHNASNSSSPQEFGASDIRRHVLRLGIRSLTLSVTEDCNFRCKYCFYSDHYEYSRDYSNKYMNFSVAKKAIDYYFSLFNEGMRYNPFRELFVGFYGGEPLLNFNLIKKCIEYINNKYKNQEVGYGITTNGSLLHNDRADWLMDHGFRILVSLDGPAEEHNRLRVYKNGQGTFRDVMKNVAYLMDAGYKDIRCLPVFDWKSDLFKIEEFFKRKDIPSVDIAAPVVTHAGCSYYRQFTEEDRFAFKRQFEMAGDNYFTNPDLLLTQKDKSSFFDELFGRNWAREFIRGNSIYRHHPVIPFTAACFPGKRIFVSTMGIYYMCEKINAFSIGSVDEGLDYGKISEIICEYNSSLDKCKDCKLTRRCSNCYVHFATDKNFLRSSEVCEGIESDMEEMFMKIFAVAEKYPEFIDQFNSYYKNIMKNCGDR